MARQHNLSEQRITLTELAKRLRRLSTEERRAAIEISTSLAGVSLKTAKEFVEVVPSALKILSPSDLRSWGEFGRRLSMVNSDLGARFFSAGVDDFHSVPEPSRETVFSLLTRQLVLSSAVALECFRLIPRLAVHFENEAVFESVITLASEIATRSAKHSAEFLRNSFEVAVSLRKHVTVNPASDEISVEILSLAKEFAARTGGMTADLWKLIPETIDGLDTPSIEILCRQAKEYLDMGGTVTLHFLTSGADIMRRAPRLFSSWNHIVRTLGASSNSTLTSFLRYTPRLLGGLQNTDKGDSNALDRVIDLIGEIAEVDPDSALAAFQATSKALRRTSLSQYEDWIRKGLPKIKEMSPKARRSYFALETRDSNVALNSGATGLSLDRIQNILRIYIEGLTGREIEIFPLTAVPQEGRIGDGKKIYLPTIVDEFDGDHENFRLFKVLAAYGAGQIEFGTFEKDTPELVETFKALNSLYSASAEQRDAFSLAGYIEDLSTGKDARIPDGTSISDLAHPTIPKVLDYSAILHCFPDRRLASRVFTTMENARIDAALRRMYRGLRRDMDMMRELLKRRRPNIFDIPMNQVPSELLFQITLCGGASDDARRFYGQVVSEIEAVVSEYLTNPISTVADSLMATSRVYTLFLNVTPAEKSDQDIEDDSPQSELDSQESFSHESALEAETRPDKRLREKQDVRELFSAWNLSEEDKREEADVRASDGWGDDEGPEQSLEAGETAFAYDEWDREISDYRVGWSRVIEKKVKKGDRGFVEITRSRYRGTISQIRRQFQLLKPENLTKTNRELDGEDYDLNALVEFVVDRKSDGRQSENIYSKKLRKSRDVAVSLLLDQSSSTARTITRNPLQPYTHPGRRIIEIEKEGLVLMSEALEAVGDIYSIAGFTSEGRRNVKYFLVKDFSEKYSEEVERRIGGLSFQNNTRLGAAIRHAAKKLLEQESKTKLLIILTDGRPYDHDYGDARYARDDVREALNEAKILGVTPFCITIDKESESELKDLYGDVGYTIIDDVLTLPERMPAIYKRLTS